MRRDLELIQSILMRGLRLRSFVRGALELVAVDFRALLFRGSGLHNFTLTKTRVTIRSAGPQAAE